MKKNVSVFILVLLFTFTLSTGIRADAKDDGQANKDEIISIDKIYNTWEEAREFEHIFYDNDTYKGLLMFKCAYRIGDTKKVKVTYESRY